MSQISMDALRRLAEALGLEIGTHAPGDGVRRYEFLYGTGSGQRKIHTSLGKGEAEEYLRGFSDGARYGNVDAGASRNRMPERNPPRSRGHMQGKFHVGHNKILVIDKVWKALRLERTTRFPSTADIGGYPLYYIIVNESGRDHATVLASTLNDDKIAEDDAVIGVEVNWEDDTLTDDITGEPIPSAYK